eukprot:CAMPEP_0116106866 /NCGR_PEP_ID=MMETSP0327-20121206/15887_1 /TAXON_ID=44447 /ORGANISM="Pseudo-nitzschia delicatissima, Strain B596" /LENGTH=188 /DNA_ID=CAMNT_0003599553 /DNA_START=600 /DNA_END=1169 /DNA_ORIENTATION=+
MIRTIFVIDHTTVVGSPPKETVPSALGAEGSVISTISDSESVYTKLMPPLDGVKYQRVSALVASSVLQEGSICSQMEKVEIRLNRAAPSAGSGNYREESCCRHPEDCHRGHSEVHLATSLLQLHVLRFNLLGSKFVKDMETSSPMKYRHLALVSKDFPRQTSLTEDWGSVHHERKRRFITDSYEVGPS